MSEQLSFPDDGIDRDNWTPEPEAHARRTDPETSHEAAKSVKKIRESQQAILLLFEQHGPMRDDQLIILYRAYKITPPQSVSSLRSRRSELVDKGKLKDSGEKTRMPSGRNGIVWSVA